MPSGDDPRLFATVKFPIKDANGKITGVGGISIDVTERRKAMDSLAAEQELLRHTIGVQDHERQLIAYEIHDGLVQYATGALMELEALRDRVNSKDSAERIDKVLDILRSTVAEGRRLINGIRTPVLDDSGVVAALQDLIDEEARVHVQVEFVKDDNCGRLAPSIEEALYRITQEALTNIRKHSQSKIVRVELGRRADQVHLEIRDWGVGFASTARIKGVHGLKGMAERARIAGGRCCIHSSPGSGTKVEVDLPYLSRTCSNG
jgi:signal transduction histidine kinase